MKYNMKFLPVFCKKPALYRISGRLSRRIFLALLLGVLLSCAGPLMPRSYTLRAPPLPPSWAFLGAPSWNIEWMDREGTWRQAHISPAAAPGDPLLSIEPGETWTSAVLAWPCWPGRGLEKGSLRPAGAILPFDQKEGQAILSWRGGVDAFFYRELARLTWGTPRGPERFNWPRFRDLFTDPRILSEIREDPWLVDWTETARKTAASGFSRRYLASAYTETLHIPGLSQGPWAAYSPFAHPPNETGGGLELKTAPWTDTWVSPQGILKVSPDTHIWISF
jgi:hypothetical protein